MCESAVCEQASRFPSLLPSLIVCTRSSKTVTAQKHVWLAQIVLLSADGVGTSAIMRETGKSKTCVRRWRERFASEGVKGLLRDKTRPSRVPKLASSVTERVVELTMERRARSPTGQARRWRKPSALKRASSAVVVASLVQSSTE
jgi:transposase